MPKLDFDVITLGHGSGGVLTNKLLKSGVFDLLKNPLLDTHHDGAVFELNGKTAFSTDSYVISPIFFPGGNIGELAINGTVNDLAMCGAQPKYLSLSFIIEEGLKMTEFWEVLVSIKKAADTAGVQIVTGDTKVVEKGKGDKLFINTAGVGQLMSKANIDMNQVKPGDKVIVSDSIANHGIAVMSIREGLEFETSILSDTRPLNGIVGKLIEEFGYDIHLLRDATRGGVASVLNEIAQDAQVGIEILQKHTPVDPEVEGACEMLGLDPLYVANEGVFMIIADAQIADDIVQMLRTFEGSKKATILGEIVEGHKRQVILQSAIGGKRVLNMLVGEQLPRIC
ncbi:hydrogenase [Jiulongibacter sediminis]|uniref:Hydrogenase n=2 Tax=Jiulongibacter sediminis TaxID=1605367 RepID=A0A0P7C606_9BACT|nr:hydrogenase [Jiulongibacter sediminis]TBX26775.1 hydrogenase [Jiulongibacter sediminis]